MEAPCWANWVDISNPIPDPPPVKIATFPFRISALEDFWALEGGRRGVVFVLEIHPFGIVEEGGFWIVCHCQSRYLSPNLQAWDLSHNGHSPTETGCTISTRGHSGGIRNSHLYTPEMKVKPYTGEGLICTRFDKAKEEVDSYLSTFAGNLVGVLKRSIETHPEWEETVVDLLVLAHSCVMTAPGEFWFKREGIVQDLDDRRKKLPAGLLKHLHTQMLIILTRCTRVVQLLKGSGLAEDYNIFQLSQSLQPPDRSIQPNMGMDEGGAANPFKVPPTRKFYSQEQQEELKNKLTVQTEYYSSSPESTQDLDTPSRIHGRNFFSSSVNSSGRCPSERCAT